MTIPYYPGLRYTPNLGLGLFGQDEVLAENFVILDSAVAAAGHPGGTTGQVQYNNAGAFGGIAEGTLGFVLTSNGPGVPPSFQAASGGTSVLVNGSSITNPNFNDSTPAAPAGGVNVLWQVSGSSVSAYVLNSSLAPAWSSLTGNLSNGQVIPYADAGISRLGAASVAIGNGTAGDFSGALKLTQETIIGTGQTGAATNVQPLEIHNTGNGIAGFYVHSAGNGPTVNFASSTGTQASPTATTASQFISFIGWRGYDGSAYQTGAQIGIQASGLWSGSNRAAVIQFSVVKAATTAVVEALRIGSTVNTVASSFPLGALQGMPIGWMPSTTNNAFDTGFSRLNAASAALGNGTQGDFSGSLKLSTLTLGGSSSGTASISVPAAAGTPNTLLLPTATGTSGQVLVTDGANPQQLSWSSKTPVTGTVDLTGQTASVGTTNIIASATAGVYRLSYYMKITTAGSTSGSVTLTLSYTDRDDSVVVTYVVPTPANAIDSSSVVSGTLVVDAKTATAITYATSYSSSGGTAMQYKLRLKAEAL
jgi:hypothetical protein